MYLCSVKQIIKERIMITTLTNITAFWVNTLGCMCILGLAMCTVNAIHGIFIPCCKQGAVGVGFLLTLVVIVKTFKSTLWIIIAAVVGFFWFVMYGTFVVIRNLVTNKA